MRDEFDSCQVDLIGCEGKWTCPEIEDALDCTERDRDAWKEMAENCVDEVLEVKAR